MIPFQKGAFARRCVAMCLYYKGIVPSVQDSQIIQMQRHITVGANLYELQQMKFRRLNITSY